MVKVAVKTPKTRKKISCQNVVKTVDRQNKERVLKSAREKHQLTYKTRLTQEISQQKLKKARGR